MTRTWADNSFWESFDQNRITTILTTENEDGTITTQQLVVNKYNTDSTENLDYNEIVDTLSVEKITSNTEERNKRKAAEREELEILDLEKKKAKELQVLFEAKIQAFEIDEIKNSQNRILKSKLRKSQNLIEVNIYSMMIVMEELNNENKEQSAA
jgi:hypothetical protein|tara:strand:+ start:35 stop:499 length:465 start_codon:yes stop_codon:yes gene_type:complete